MNLKRAAPIFRGTLTVVCHIPEKMNRYNHRRAAAKITFCLLAKRQSVIPKQRFFFRKSILINLIVKFLFVCL